VAGFRTFEEIAAWRIAYELKLAVFEICKRESFRADTDLRSQLVDAARSSPRNIAEGFGRWHHRDFARFVRIARASQIELLNHLLDARDSGHITEAERAELEHTTKRALKAANGLIRYLERSPDPK
jgi:four helix bundle protein